MGELERDPGPAGRRVTDTDRDDVVARLRAATVDGSLDLDELGDRITLVYQARTAGELVAVTKDLPEPVRPPTPPEPVRRRSVWRNAAFRIHAATYGMTNGFLVGIWAVTPANEIFWPFFPAAGWGIGLGLHGMVAAGVEQRRASRAQRGAKRPGRSDRADRASRLDRRRADRWERAEQQLREAAGRVERLREAARELATAAKPIPPPPPLRGPRSVPDGGRAPAPPQPARSSSTRVAVLFVDIVNSTQLTSALGDVSWSHLRARHRAMVGEHLGAHGGSEVNVAGDGLLARFDNEIGAVRCAIEIQRSLQRQRADSGFAPSVRIGIHTGEVVSDGDDLVGSVVNLASRVTSEADPDGVMLTEAVAERVGDRFELDDRGLRHLKGVAQPRHLLAVVWE